MIAEKTPKKSLFLIPPFISRAIPLDLHRHHRKIIDQRLAHRAQTFNQIRLRLSTMEYH